MALKIRCPYCDEMMTFNTETDTYHCICGTMTKLPEGKAQSNPYSDWGSCYQADVERKRPDATSKSNNRGRSRNKKTQSFKWRRYYGEA